MPQVNIHDAKTHFSKLVERVLAGEDIVVAKAGKPVVKIVRLDPKAVPQSRLGMLAGKLPVPDDIKSPFADDIERMFYGGADRA